MDKNELYSLYLELCKAEVERDAIEEGAKDSQEHLRYLLDTIKDSFVEGCHHTSIEEADRIAEAHRECRYLTLMLDTYQQKVVNIQKKIDLLR